MKRLIISVLVLLILGSTAFAQLEKGDKEVQLQGTFVTYSGMSVIILNATYGYFIKENIQLGVGPAILYATAGGDDYTQFGSSFFGRYYFTTTEKLVPYIGGQWYQMDFSPEDGASFTDYTYLQATGGFKYMVSENVAYDVSANLGFPLGSGGGTIFMILGGLSAFF
ncbi:MAG: hypothetical protein ABIJ45_04020 [Candidatus Zixiibacteriota bacterium]